MKIHVRIRTSEDSTTELECVHDFGTGRAIADYDGAFVIVDRIGKDIWELSGEAARPGEELNVLNTFVKEGTTTTVTK